MLRCRTAASFVVVALAAGSLASATTITVRRDGSGHFATLQPALDAAAPGDTVDVGPGEFPETAPVHLPGCLWDIEMCGHVRVARLTILGAGAGQTVVGPDQPAIDYAHQSPQGLHAGAAQDLTVRGVTFRNVYLGLRGPNDELTVSDCSFTALPYGLSCLGTALTLEDCSFQGLGSYPTGAVASPGCEQATVRRCAFGNAKLFFHGVLDFLAEGCSFADGMTGLHLAGPPAECRGEVNRCSFRDEWVSILSLGVHVELADIATEGGGLGAFIEGGVFTLTSSAITGTTAAALRLAGDALVTVHASDLSPAGGWAVECTDAGPPARNLDLTGNYWGATDPVAIAALIWDALDTPAVDDTIVFEPFAGGTTPAERVAGGALKSTFR